MPETKENADSRSVDLAMNQVLAAERDARAAVDACREDARRILDQAESRSRRISRRAERRIQNAHRTADAAVQRAIEGLRRAGSGRQSSYAAETDEERLAQAVERLADEIVGGSE
mgnify:CR=1 FL=1